MKYLCLLTALLAGCSKPAEEAKAPDPTAEVRTAVAAAGAAVETLSVYGAAEADLAGSRSLVSQREATLASIVAPAGTPVQAGQVVATLRSSPLSQLDVLKAGNDVRTATAALERAIRLRSEGLASDADVDAARAAATTATATRNSLKGSQASLVLHAPIQGIVQNLTARPGDLLAAGTTVATVAAAGHLKARFGVDPSVAQTIHAGQPIHISLVNGGAPLNTEISGVDTQVDATTRLAAVFARLPPAYGAGPGVPLKAALSLGRMAPAITIPYAALLDDGGKAYVFVVAGGVAHRTDVRTGNSTAGDIISLTSGVPAGAHVVIEGGTALEDGMKVREKAAGK